MSYSIIEWEWIRDHFIEGCRFFYGKEKEGATIHLGGSPFFSRDRFHARFDNTEYAQHWEINGMNIWYKELSNATWPNGSPMVPFVEYDGTKWDPVEAKVRSLDARFKANSLPKTTQKALPLPA